MSDECDWSQAFRVSLALARRGTLETSPRSWARSCYICERLGMSDDWPRLLAKSVTTPRELAEHIPLSEVEIFDLERVAEKYPMRINPYYLGLIKEKDDPLWKQMVPDVEELNDEFSPEDPLYEDVMSPVPGLTHRYPDRVLLLVSAHCAAYCRFCTRKRKVGNPFIIQKQWLKEGLEYISSHRQIRDVILSGGDPLLLTDADLESIVREVRRIRHVEIVRIGTRVPCTLPMRVTPRLVRMLRKYHPLFVNVHFNHPDEVTPQAKTACEMLADAGIPLGNQSVLLKGVNDSPRLMKRLCQKLLSIRVRPYYIYQCDISKGTRHFRTPVSKGIEMIEKIRGWTSGLAVPHFVIDAPGGGGKIPILPEYVVEHNEHEIVVRNYRGMRFKYPEVEAEQFVPVYRTTAKITIHNNRHATSSSSTVQKVLDFNMS